MIYFQSLHVRRHLLPRTKSLLLTSPIHNRTSSVRTKATTHLKNLTYSIPLPSIRARSSSYSHPISNQFQLWLTLPIRNCRRPAKRFLRDNNILTKLSSDNKGAAICIRKNFKRLIASLQSLCIYFHQLKWPERWKRLVCPNIRISIFRNCLRCKRGSDVTPRMSMNYISLYCHFNFSFLLDEKYERDSWWRVTLRK